MNLHIKTESFLKEIQAAFNQHYPYLKIEFFSKRHADRKLSPETAKLDNGKTIRDAAVFFDPADISINADRTVSALEKDFWIQFGLAIQVYRNSNGLWLETSATDTWSLDQQNRAGEASCKRNDGKSLEERLEDTRFDEER
ncbi:MAG TPA: hypothetical protein PLC48_13345 [Ferruginibacter sp.]|nr:hypothetical protein [Ferruginibacter sp.]